MAIYSNKTVCVIDNGLFIELAITLSKDFGTVLYWCPWENAFPRTNTKLIGAGIENVYKIDSIWPLLDEIDLFVFPDVYQGPLQIHLDNLGKRVWGGRMGEQLELLRHESKQHMRGLGIDIGKYQVIKGISKLREFLKTHENQFIKISTTRGDMETFKAKNYNLVEPKIDEIDYKLGAKKDLVEFIVEDEIPDAVEIGYDGWTIDGKFTENAMVGLEVKDKGLILKTEKYEELPEPARRVNKKLIPTFKNYKYRGFFSSEIRVTKDHKAYVIDPCCRCGSPPSELFWLIIDNWADILWEGAKGIIVEPHFVGKFGAELLIHSSWADKNWQPVEFPNSVREHLKFRNLTIINNKYYVVPQDVGLPEIGAVVALGNTMEEAMKNVCNIAEKIEGYYITTMPECLDEAKEQIEKLEEFGIPF